MLGEAYRGAGWQIAWRNEQVTGVVETPITTCYAEPASIVRWELGMEHGPRCLTDTGLDDPRKPDDIARYCRSPGCNRARKHSSRRRNSSVARGEYFPEETGTVCSERLSNPGTGLRGSA